MKEFPETFSGLPMGLRARLRCDCIYPAIANKLLGLAPRLARRGG
jgi:hypothetical protein